MSIARATKNNGCIPTDLEHEPHKDNEIRVPRHTVDEDDRNKLEIGCKMNSTGQCCLSQPDFLKSDSGQLINFSFNCHSNNRGTRCIERAGTNGYGLSNVAHLRINCNKEISGGSKCYGWINFSNPASNRTSVDPENAKFMINCSQFGFPNLTCNGKQVVGPELDQKRGMAGFDMSCSEIDRNELTTCVKTPNSKHVSSHEFTGFEICCLNTSHDKKRCDGRFRVAKHNSDAKKAFQSSSSVPFSTSISPKLTTPSYSTQNLPSTSSNTLPCMLSPTSSTGSSTTSPYTLSPMSSTSSSTIIISACLILSLGVVIVFIVVFLYVKKHRAKRRRRKVDLMFRKLREEVAINA